MSAVELVEKRCPACGEVKPLSEYHQNKSNPDGRHHYCKPCNKAQVKARNVRRRREMGEEAWLTHRAEVVRRSRERTGNAAGKLYGKARRRAIAALVEAHRAEFDARLRLALDELERMERIQ